MKRLEYFFDYVSPFSYMADTQLGPLAERTGAEIVYRPFFLGGVMNLSKNSPPVTVPNKGRYMFADITRWARRYGIEVNPNPHFPVNTLSAMRAAIAALDDPRFPAFHQAMYRGAWVDGKSDDLAGRARRRRRELRRADGDDLHRCRELDRADDVARPHGALVGLFVDDTLDVRGHGRGEARGDAREDVLAHAAGGGPHVRRAEALGHVGDDLCVRLREPILHARVLTDVHLLHVRRDFLRDIAASADWDAHDDEVGAFDRGGIGLDDLIGDPELGDALSRRGRAR